MITHKLIATVNNESRTFFGRSAKRVNELAREWMNDQLWHSGNVIVAFSANQFTNGVSVWSHAVLPHVVQIFASPSWVRDDWWAMLIDNGSKTGRDAVAPIREASITLASRNFAG